MTESAMIEKINRYLNEVYQYPSELKPLRLWDKENTQYLWRLGLPGLQCSYVVQLTLSFNGPGAAPRIDCQFKSPPGNAPDAHPSEREMLAQAFINDLKEVLKLT